MTSSLERLRRLHGLRPHNRDEPRPAPAPRQEMETSAAATGNPFDDAPPQPIERLLPGEVWANEGGECYVVTRRYALREQRGGRTMHPIFGRSPQAMAPLYPDAGLDRTFDFGQAVFIDTETTGLGGGAGIYPFMVGVGTFEPSAPGDAPEFVVRQLFMRHPGEELGLLTALAGLLEGRQGLVTFNGRTFDVPLLRGRYRFNRHWLPIDPPDLIQDGSAPHLDLLHPSRRLWSQQLPSCRLSALEQDILAHARREEDVPGYLIPALYAQYLQDQNGRPMQGIFYHNQEDILSMVYLAERVCDYVGDPLEGERADLNPQTLLALGQIHEQAGEMERAERALRAAIAGLSDGRSLAAAYDKLGWLLRRQERWDEAAALWEAWISRVPGPDPRPFEALAKYCEWQLGDLTQAEMWTAWALHNQQSAPAYQRSPQTISELEHRLARIRGKLAE